MQQKRNQLQSHKFWKFICLLSIKRNMILRLWINPLGDLSHYYELKNVLTYGNINYTHFYIPCTTNKYVILYFIWQRIWHCTIHSKFTVFQHFLALSVDTNILLKYLNVIVTCSDRDWRDIFISIHWVLAEHEHSLLLASHGDMQSDTNLHVNWHKNTGMYSIKTEKSPLLFIS